MMERRTTCPYCGVGCGILAKREENGDVTVRGDFEHPANFGRLCSKGSALAETLSLDDRLLFPEIAGERATWDAALDLIAKKFSETIAQHGPDSVAFYVSGQLLTEDYYVANKLMKGFIGSANIDTNSRLCMASSVAGHKRAFGADVVPGNYEDLELADLVVLVGSNLAWCHPVLFQRLMAAKEARGTKIVVVDPRRTATAEFAELHLAIKPGSDVALFNGLLAYLHDHSKIDAQFVSEHTTGLANSLAAARECDVAKITGVSQSELEHFYRLFADTERTVTVWSQGVNQSSAGTDKVNAIINSHLLTGRIGREGMGPFSVTGQPNAMGGREVGGLANMLAAHMTIENPAHQDIVQRFWVSPVMATKPGLKAVDMFEAVRDGRIKAIWIMATNPVVSMPDADAVREALKQCPFVVVSDAIRDTDTARLAHVLLPAAAWGEKDGTVTNSERRISRQRAFLPVAGESRADWKIISNVARRMGFAGFGYESAAEVFSEHAALSAFENNGTRALDIGAFAGMSNEAYETLLPFQWPRPRDTQSTSRMFGDGKFSTESGRANIVATPFRKPKGNISASFPLVLNTGRIRDQWHTMTRTGKSARLMAHIGEPFIEIHPADARNAGIVPASLVRVSSDHGEVILRALVSEKQQRGTVFVPMHWNDTNSNLARVDALIAPNPDPVSGQPELKFTPVAAKPFLAAWYGFAVIAQRPEKQNVGYWAEARAENGFRMELAGVQSPENWTQFAEGLLQSSELMAYVDEQAGAFRYAAFENQKFMGALFVSREPVAVARNWLADQLGKVHSRTDAFRILAGRSDSSRDCGSIVCACNNVGKTTILSAIAGGARTVNAVSDVTKAGTSCGSCRAEILGMLHGRHLQAAK
jgi:assimilatory nitrate reductase catalytic subunit